MYRLIDTLTIKDHGCIHRGSLFCKTFLQFRLGGLNGRIMFVTQDMFYDLQYDGDYRDTTVVVWVSNISFL